jgi:RNA polymerase sigma-70 factor (ECF subfamily)
VLHRTERQILENIREGDTEACTAFVKRYYKSVFSLLAYLSGDRNIAEDLTQDTFACAGSSISGYKAKASLKTWLHRIAYNKFLDSKRKVRQTSTFESGLTEKNYNIQENSEPFSEITKDEHSRILFDAMRKLEPAEYAVIVLHYIQDFSYREMAAVLKEPAGTVKWRTSRAVKRLKETLTGRI